MKTNLLETMEEKLLARRQAITRVLEHLQRDSNVIIGERQIDWLDQAWEENAARTLDGLVALYRTEMENIGAALARMRRGTFGLCAACHEEIESYRLESFPYAQFCASCAELREAVQRAAA